MPVDHPHGGGERTPRNDARHVEAKRLSVFYRNIPKPPPVYLATDRYGHGVSHPTVCKISARRDTPTGGRVEVFEKGVLTGYC